MSISERAFDGARWRKSSHSATGNDTCVELADVAGLVGVRDSVDPDGPKLAFTRGQMRALAARIAAGELDA